MSNEEFVAKPNYNRKCQNCEQVPTVDIYSEDGVLQTHIDLCGPCCFGNADCIDPKNW